MKANSATRAAALLHFREAPVDPHRLGHSIKSLNNEEHAPPPLGAEGRVQGKQRSELVKTASQKETDRARKLKSEKKCPFVGPRGIRGNSAILR